MDAARILYVEWYKDAEEAMVQLLRAAGYEVTASPTLAGSVLLARQEHFDLCLLSEYTGDSHTGIELCREIRAFDSQTPILFYSTLASTANQTDALNAGAQTYLIKPCEFDHLNLVIGGLIKDAACRY